VDLRELGLNMKLRKQAMIRLRDVMARAADEMLATDGRTVADFFGSVLGRCLVMCTTPDRPMRFSSLGTNARRLRPRQHPRPTRALGTAGSRKRGGGAGGGGGRRAGGGRGAICTETKLGVRLARVGGAAAAAGGVVR
jgi:hypothetical protein